MGNQECGAGNMFDNQLRLATAFTIPFWGRSVALGQSNFAHVGKLTTY
jgi:hypothetical protein